MAAQIIFMFLLLLGSAFFSGAETAFSNISHRNIQYFNQSGHKLSILAAKLLAKSRQLLNCLLFGNMTVNVLYYAAASILTVRMGQKNPIAAAFAASLSFMVLVLFGEIIPKSIAFTNSKALCIFFALPAYLWMRIFSPVEFFFKSFFLEPALRLILGPKRKQHSITTAEFSSLINATRKEGLITAEENKLFTEVIELGFLKVRHVMKPRVDMTALEVTQSNKNSRRIMMENHLTKIPVYVHNIDNIVGIVHLRQLLLNNEKPLDKLVQAVHFVPEQKTVESLLEFFRSSRTDMAIVVDEYGGIAGSVQLEDIAEELFGEFVPAGVDEPVQQTGPFEYRLAGNMSIHDWADFFGVALTETRQATIGGLVTALLGKIPKQGDVVYFKNLKITIENVRKNRIEMIRIKFELIDNDV